MKLEDVIMLSVSRNMKPCARAPKYAPPLFIRALSAELKEEIKPLRMILLMGRKAKKEDDEEEKATDTKEETLFEEPRRRAQVIKLKWEDEQKHDEEPLAPGDVPGQQRISSRGGRRLRY
jgi:hypothetical protein